jgi:uncharacterized protein YeaO (DUF488 family)
MRKRARYARFQSGSPVTRRCSPDDGRSHGDSDRPARYAEGTVRHLPRGVRKDRYAADDWFDVWLPNLAPSASLVAVARAAASDAHWRRFVARYTREMARPDARHLIDALVALSRHTDFSVGCYCEDERRCHRSVLREILEERGATVS